MRAYREQDFDKMAERVVDRFMDGAKLADAATGEAQEGALNPDQIAGSSTLPTRRRSCA